MNYGGVSVIIWIWGEWLMQQKGIMNHVDNGSRLDYMDIGDIVTHQRVCIQSFGYAGYPISLYIYYVHYILYL